MLYSISYFCLVTLSRGEQKFLFALLGDGIGICFLTNFGNFWDFEDPKDFRILEYSKTFLRHFQKNCYKIQKKSEKLKL